jgi:hypothetical protein
MECQMGLKCSVRRARQDLYFHWVVPFGTISSWAPWSSRASWSYSRGPWVLLNDIILIITEHLNTRSRYTADACTTFFSGVHINQTGPKGSNNINMGHIGTIPQNETIYGTTKLKRLNIPDIILVYPIIWDLNILPGAHVTQTGSKGSKYISLGLNWSIWPNETI